VRIPAKGQWLRGLSLRRRLLLSGFAALLVVIGTVSVIATTNGGRAPAQGFPAQDRPGPVLLVPGYGGGQGGLSVLADRIRVAGREAQVLTLTGDGTGDLLAQVDVLARAVDSAYSDGAPSVDVIGYSAGGVVARLWVARHGGEHQARRMITLGSPLHGARIAAVGGALVPSACPLACRQLAPGSALLNSFEQQPLPAGLPWLSLWTENDQTVIPPDSARLAGAINVALQQVCAGAPTQHGDLPTDPAVTGMVLRALGTDPLRAPRPGECS
jgi:triacylglycerol esterase/lipase EstA (alpha/beta hydrolase family)